MTETRVLGAVPFADHARVETLSAGPEGGVARIPDAPELTNHIASVHAGALFTLGETASGAAMLGAFADLMGQVRPVTRSSEIRYLRIARGAIEARGVLAEPATAIRARLDEAGKVDFAVDVALTDAAGEKVAEMTVTWNLSRRPPRA
jgi:acyl-coenzyme A thioesterase PaaI-like protein